MNFPSNLTFQNENPYGRSGPVNLEIKNTFSPDASSRLAYHNLKNLKKYSNGVEFISSIDVNFALNRRRQSKDGKLNFKSFDKRNSSKTNLPQIDQNFSLQGINKDSIKKVRVQDLLQSRNLNMCVTETSHGKQQSPEIIKKSKGKLTFNNSREQTELGIEH